MLFHLHPITQPQSLLKHICNRKTKAVLPPPSVSLLILLRRYGWMANVCVPLVIGAVFQLAAVSPRIAE